MAARCDSRVGAGYRWLGMFHVGAMPCALFHGVQHNSLFAAGVRAISGGPWVAQNCVEIVTEDGTVVARGLVNYSSQEVERIRFVASHYAGCRLVSEWWLGGDVVSLSPPPPFPLFGLRDTYETYSSTRASGGGSGCKSADIADILGYADDESVVHRGNIALLLDP